MWYAHKCPLKTLSLCKRKNTHAHTHTHTHSGSKLTGLLGFTSSTFYSLRLHYKRLHSATLPDSVLLLGFSLPASNTCVKFKSFNRLPAGSKWHHITMTFTKSVPSCLCPFLRSNNPAHRYYLATDPVTGQLYVSDTNSRRIYRPKMLSGARDLISKSEPPLKKK